MRRSPAFWLAAALSVLSAGPATAIDGDPAPLLLAQASEVEITSIRALALSRLVASALR